MIGFLEAVYAVSLHQAASQVHYSLVLGAPGAFCAGPPRASTRSAVLCIGDTAQYPENEIR